VEIRAQRAFYVLGLILGFSIAAAAVQSVTPQGSRHSSKRRAHLHRASWNPVFRPSRESLLRQNEEIDRLALPRIHDDAELRELVASGDLVPIEEGETLHIERRLDPSRRYCRPWTRDFLEDFSQAYYQQFHSPIQVNSAVRTVVMQRKLRRHNRNAAPESGETASSHLAGITVDIQRRGMTRQQVQWVEQYMLPLTEQGLLEPEEERRQWVFHVAVSGRYADWREAKTAAGEPASPLVDPGPREFPPQRVSDVRSFDQ
jgi:Family of unknown function (DUF5715)